MPNVPLPNIIMELDRMVRNGIGTNTVDEETEEDERNDGGEGRCCGCRLRGGERRKRKGLFCRAIFLCPCSCCWLVFFEISIIRANRGG